MQQLYSVSSAKYLFDASLICFCHLKAVLFLKCSHRRSFTLKDSLLISISEMDSLMLTIYQREYLNLLWLISCTPVDIFNKMLHIAASLIHIQKKEIFYSGNFIRKYFLASNSSPVLNLYHTPIHPSSRVFTALEDTSI